MEKTLVTELKEIIAIAVEHGIELDGDNFMAIVDCITKTRMASQHECKCVGQPAE